MKTSNTKRVVKGWAVLENGTDALTLTDVMEQDADCACRAFTYDASPFFRTKKLAEDYCNFRWQKVVPCTITYTLPHKKQKK